MGEVSSGKNEQFALANGPFIDDLPIKHFFHNYVKLPESNHNKIGNLISKLVLTKSGISLTKDRLFLSQNTETPAKMWVQSANSWLSPVKIGLGSTRWMEQTNMWNLTHLRTCGI